MKKEYLQKSVKNSFWIEEVDKISFLLSQLSFTDADNNEMPQDAGFEQWSAITRTLRQNRKICFMAGNGASASMASHTSADLAKNAKLHTQVFTDLSLITAVGNDINYESVFSEPLKLRGGRGDLLVVISSSGRSPNILKAVKSARELGMTVVTLSAMDVDNPLRTGGDINAYIPAKEYAHAETCHAAILHLWVDMVCL